MTGCLLGNAQSINVINATIDPANIAAASVSEQTFTVPGLKVGDFVCVAKPTVTTGFAISSARVSATDILAITIITNTTNVDAPSEVWRIQVIRPEHSAATRIYS